MSKIRGHFHKHFQHLPSKTLPMGSFRRLTPIMANELELVPNEVEIINAIKSCNPGKLGYDEFNLRFMTKMWDVIGLEVLGFVNFFF